MPRQARRKSKTGIYHIILRGINRQILFEENEDKEKFIDTIKQYKEKSGYKVLGYCLMDNHVHLLLQEGKETMDNTMKRIGVSYVYWYNWKYKRSGHLFQDRYKSEPVEDEEYLVAVLRYIHQNPLKAEVVHAIRDYKWSSYHEYIQRSKIVDTDLVMGLFSNDKQRLREYFDEVAIENGNKVLEVRESIKLSDQEALVVIEKSIGRLSLSELQQTDRDRRDEILRNLKQIDALSIRQIARITGITVNIIAKA
jgi:putative transposase